MSLTSVGYDYRGWARYRLAAQLEQVEELYDKERTSRVDTQRSLLHERSGHNNLHWELKDANNRLESEAKAHRFLQKKVEELQRNQDLSVEREKQLSREKKEIKVKISYLEEEVRRYQLEASKARIEARDLSEQLQHLRQEHLHDEEKVTDFRHREMAAYQDRLRDWELRHKELQAKFDAERDRFEKRQTVELSNMRRVQLERQYAQEELAKSLKLLEAKQDQLEQTMQEIEKLETELKQCDDELELLHGHVIDLENEKRTLRLKLEEAHKVASEELQAERNNHFVALDALRKENDSLLARLNREKESETSAYRRAREENLQALRELQVDLDAALSENVELKAQIKELRAEEKKPPETLLEERRIMQAEIVRLQQLLDQLKELHDHEVKELAEDIREAEDRSRRLQRVIEDLKEELKARNSDQVDENVDLSRTIGRLEEKIRRLQDANTELAVERESLLVSEVHLKKQIEEDSRLATESQSDLEIKNSLLSKQKEKLEVQLKSLSTDHENTKSELEKVSKIADDLRKEVRNVGILEKKVELLEEAARERELAFKHEVDELQQTIASWKSKHRVAERDADNLQKEIQKNKQKERASFDAEKQLRKQVGDLQNRLHNAEMERNVAEKQRNEIQAKLSTDLMEAKNQSSDSQKKSIKEDREREKAFRDLIDDVKLKAQAELRDVKLDHDNVQKGLREEIHSLQGRVERFGKELEKAQSEISTRQATIDDLRSQLQSKEVDSATVGQVQVQYDQALQELKKIRGQLTKLESDNNDLRSENKSLTGKVERLQKSLQESDEKAQGMAKEKAEFASVENKLREQITSAAAEANTYKEKVEALKDKNEELDRENNQLNVDKARLGLELQQARGSERLSQMESSLARLKTELDQRDVKSREELRRESEAKAKLEKELETVKIGYGRAVTEAEKATKLQAELKAEKEKLEKRLQESSKELVAKKSEMADVERQLRQAQVLMQNKNLEQNEAAGVFSNEIKTLNDEIASLKAAVDALKSEISSRDDQIRELGKQNADKVEQMKKVREQADEDLAELAIELEDSQATIASREKEKADLLKELDQLKKTLAKGDEGAAEERANLKAELIAVTQQRDSLKASIESLSGEKTSLEKSSAALEVSIAALKKDVEAKKAEISTLQAKIASLEESLKAANTAVASANAAAASAAASVPAPAPAPAAAPVSAPATPAPVDSAVTEELEGLRKKLKEAEKKLKERKAEIKTLKADKKSPRKSKKPEELEAEIEGLKKDLAAKDSEIAALKSRLDNMPAVVTTPPADDLESSDVSEDTSEASESGPDKKLIELPKKEKHGRRHSSSSPKPDKELQRSKKKIAELEEKVTKLNTKSSKWSKEKADLKSQIHALQKQLAQVTDQKDGKEPTPVAQLSDDPKTRAVVLLQSAIRGRIARNKFKTHQRRFKIVSEILTTEQNYVKQLHTIVELYLTPLRSLKILSDEVLDGLFSNVWEIYTNNQKFLDELETRVESWTLKTKIGDVFSKNMQLLEPHAEYCSRYGSSLALKKSILSGSVKFEVPNGEIIFNSFLQFARLMPQASGKTLDDFLIVPVQRIPRYKLLLADLFEKTPKDHPDSNFLKQALNMTSRLASTINEATRKFESQSRMVVVNETVSGLTEVLPANPERGVHDQRDLPCLLSGEKVSNYTAILLSDCLVFAKASKKKKRLSINPLSSEKQDVMTYKAQTVVFFKAGLDCTQSTSATFFEKAYEHVLQVGPHYVILPSADISADWFKFIKASLPRELRE